MTEVPNLVEQFVQAAKPIEKTVSLSFKAANQVVFEIEVNSRGDQAFNAEVLQVVQQAVSAAVSNLR